MDNDKKLKVVYRYNKNSVIAIITTALIAMPILGFVFQQFGSSQNKFYDSRTGEVVTPGFFVDSAFMGIVLLIAAVIIIIIAIKKLKIAYYEVFCPNCGNVAYVPVQTGIGTCEACSHQIMVPKSRTNSH